MQPLDLHVEDGIGVYDDAVALFDVLGEFELVASLDLEPLVEHVPLALELFKSLELVGVLHEAVADEFGDERGEFGVRLREPPAVGDAVGDVGEHAGVHLVVVVEHVVFEDLGVELGDAVDGVRRGEAHVRHLDLIVRKHCVVGDLVPIVGIERPKLVAEALVDLADDLIDARQKLLEDALGPLLERLRHDRMVGVGDRAPDDAPRVVPAVTVLVEQQPHQFGDAQRGVCVVDVDRDLVGQVVERAVVAQMRLDDGLNGSRHKEVLLFETQHLALDVVVRRIEHLADGLGESLVLQRLDILPLREQVHVEVDRRLRRPKPELVDRRDVIAADVHVIGHRLHDVAVLVVDVEPAVVPMLVDRAAEAHLEGVLFARSEPDVAVFEPLVGHLDLPAVCDLLLEDAVVVSDRKTACDIVEVGQRLHIRRRQSAETAVAETRVGLDRVKLVQRHAERLDRLGKNIGHAEVEQVVFERPAQQKLHRHVVDLFCFLFLALALELQTHLGQDVPDGHADRLVDLSLACLGKRHSEIGLSLDLEDLFDARSVVFSLHILSRCQNSKACVHKPYLCNYTLFCRVCKAFTRYCEKFRNTAHFAYYLKDDRKVRRIARRCDPTRSRCSSRWRSAFSNRPYSRSTARPRARSRRACRARCSCRR